MRIGFSLCFSLYSVHLGLCTRSYPHAPLTLWTLFLDNLDGCQRDSKFGYLDSIRRPHALHRVRGPPGPRRYSGISALLQL